MRTVAASRRYTIVAIVLHWLIALGILALLALGLAMTRGPLSPMDRFAFYQWHKSIGLTVLVLMALRLAWRLFNPPPPLPEAMPTAERRAAGAAHLALYGLLLAMPLVGWAMVSASPYNIPTVLYGAIPWPHLPVLPELPNKAAVEGALKLVHSYGAWLLIALLLLHVGAALRHHLVLRDDTLWRMLPLVPRARAKPEVPSR
ncbi:cytochrome b [Methylobacterium nonmethylotrophicum]|uniref:Cytochrome b n=1 Tax=Methylobacterium nonmethylotrophicum TaxID=1141884 RepID=A0A4Z0NP61_9HYPH|nr:cytochrome b [Methylobacterium nonmethylotrophicum]TGD98611.1 cytochrome b [Methylobacterium nonmethylotrophicum]